MTDNEYLEFLKSDKWKDTARKRAEIDNYTCQFCGCKGTVQNPLEIHHVTYRNLGHEDVDKDLVTLCHVCHRGITRMMCRVTDRKTGQRGWKDTMPLALHVLDTFNGLDIVSD